jgi:hypothetical protein
MTKALDRLEQSSKALDESPRGDLDALASLLASRQEALEEFRKQWGQAGCPLAERERAQLEAARQAGLRLRTRLLIDKAGLRDNAQRLYQAACFMRTLEPAPEAEQFDIHA